jgi:excisionase family DNA binding protein
MELLTIDDTAQMLRVSSVTVRRFIAAGRLPAVKIGRCVQVSKDALDQFVQPRGMDASRYRNPTRRSQPGRPMTADDPLSRLVGSVTDAPPTDSSRKYEYLADAIAPKTQ